MMNNNIKKKCIVMFYKKIYILIDYQIFKFNDFAYVFTIDSIDL